MAPVHSTQEDPIGLAGGLNLYGYGDADPLNNWDPYGTSGWYRVLRFAIQMFAAIMGAHGATENGDIDGDPRPPLEQVQERNPAPPPTIHHRRASLSRAHRPQAEQVRRPGRQVGGTRPAAEVGPVAAPPAAGTALSILAPSLHVGTSAGSEC